MESIILTGKVTGIEQSIIRGARSAERALNFKPRVDASGLNRLSGPLGRLTGQANEFNKSLEASNARVLAFGASAGAIFAVQRGLQAVVRDAIEVEKVIADINSVLNQTNKNLAKFTDEIFQAAKNAGTGFQVAAEAALELSRQGLSAEATTKRLNAALVLARLGGLEAKDAVEGLTAAINSFSKEALDDVVVVNKLANVAAKFAVSERDLTEAIKRSASAASDAGVSFDELVALVTAAQQTTARGGAVIGNSLKTIFTRLQRSSTLEQLEKIGVAVRQVNGELLGAPQILKNLSLVYDGLGQEQRAFVSELVGGVFQINQLKAQLNDLSKEYGFYARALVVANDATDEAIRRNEELNKTTAASLNAIRVGITQLSAELGSNIFGPVIKELERYANVVLEIFSSKRGEDAGSGMGSALLKGIGGALSGPGVALALAGVAALFVRLGAFAIQAGKSIFDNVRGIERQRQVQAEVQALLAQSGKSYADIIRGATSLEQVERRILSIVREQVALRASAGALTSNLSPGFADGGGLSRIGIGQSKIGAAGMSFGGGRFSIKGEAPRFADPIAQAINREKMAGVPAGSIYIDSDPRVKSPQNPLGLLIANRRDEPLGGFQGVNRAIALGMDPKKGTGNGFVPNFAEFDNVSRRTPTGKVKDILGNVSILSGEQTLFADEAKKLRSLSSKVRMAVSPQDFSNAVRELNEYTKTLNLTNSGLAKVNTVVQNAGAKLGRVLAERAEEEKIAAEIASVQAKRFEKENAVRIKAFNKAKGSPVDSLDINEQLRLAPSNKQRELSAEEKARPFGSTRLESSESGLSSKDESAVDAFYKDKVRTDRANRKLREKASREFAVQRAREAKAEELRLANTYDSPIGPRFPGVVIRDGGSGKASEEAFEATRQQFRGTVGQPGGLLRINQPSLFRGENQFTGNRLPRFARKTSLESATNDLFNLSYNDLGAVYGQPVSGGRGKADAIGELRNEFNRYRTSPLQKGGQLTGMGVDLIGRVETLASQDSIQEKFKETVRKSIQGGATFNDAVTKASAQFVQVGGSSKQLIDVLLKDAKSFKDLELTVEKEKQERRNGIAKIIKRNDAEQALAKENGALQKLTVEQKAIIRQRIRDEAKKSLGLKGVSEEDLASNPAALRQVNRTAAAMAARMKNEAAAATPGARIQSLRADSFSANVTSRINRYVASGTDLTPRLKKFLNTQIEQSVLNSPEFQGFSKSQILADPRSRRIFERKIQDGIKSITEQTGLVKFDQALSGTFATRERGIAGFFGSARGDEKALRNTLGIPAGQKLTPQQQIALETRQQQTRQLRSGRQTMVGMGAGFAASALAGSGKVGDGVFAGGLGMAGTGAVLGSFIPGVGTGIGAGLGFAIGAIGAAAKKSEKEFRAAADAYQQLSASLEQNVTNAQQYATVQAQLSDLIASGNAKASDITNLNTQLTTLFNNIGDNETRRKFLDAAGNVDALNKAVSELANKNALKLAAESVGVAVTAANAGRVNKTLGFGGTTRTEDLAKIGDALAVSSQIKPEAFEEVRKSFEKLKSSGDVKAVSSALSQFGFDASKLKTDINGLLVVLDSAIQGRGITKEMEERSKIDQKYVLQLQKYNEDFKKLVIDIDNTRQILELQSSSTGRIGLVGQAEQLKLLSAGGATESSVFLRQANMARRELEFSKSEEDRALRSSARSGLVSFGADNLKEGPLKTAFLDALKDPRASIDVVEKLRELEALGDDSFKNIAESRKGIQDLLSSFLKSSQEAAIRQNEQTEIQELQLKTQEKLLRRRDLGRIFGGGLGQELNTTAIFEGARAGAGVNAANKTLRSRAFMFPEERMAAGIGSTQGRITEAQGLIQLGQILPEMIDTFRTPENLGRVAEANEFEILQKNRQVLAASLKGFFEGEFQAGGAFGPGGDVGGRDLQRKLFEALTLDRTKGGTDYSEAQRVLEASNLGIRNPDAARRLRGIIGSAGQVAGLSREAAMVRANDQFVTPLALQKEELTTAKNIAENTKNTIAAIEDLILVFAERQKVIDAGTAKTAAETKLKEEQQALIGKRQNMNELRDNVAKIFPSQADVYQTDGKKVRLTDTFLNPLNEVTGGRFGGGDLSGLSRSQDRALNRALMEIKGGGSVSQIQKRITDDEGSVSFLQMLGSSASEQEEKLKQLIFSFTQDYSKDYFQRLQVEVSGFGERVKSASEAFNQAEVRLDKEIDSLNAFLADRANKKPGEKPPGAPTTTTNPPTNLPTPTVPTTPTVPSSGGGTPPIPGTPTVPPAPTTPTSEAPTNPPGAQSVDNRSDWQKEFDEATRELEEAYERRDGTVRPAIRVDEAREKLEEIQYRGIGDKPIISIEDSSPYRRTGERIIPESPLAPDPVPTQIRNTGRIGTLPEASYQTVRTAFDADENHRRRWREAPWGDSKEERNRVWEESWQQKNKDLGNHEQVAAELKKAAEVSALAFGATFNEELKNALIAAGDETRILAEQKISSVIKVVVEDNWASANEIDNLKKALEETTRMVIEMNNRDRQNNGQNTAPTAKPPASGASR
jgi:TP901 family phage tail tape measure protein